MRLVSSNLRQLSSVSWSILRSGMLVPAQQTRASSGAVLAEPVHQRLDRSRVGDVERVHGQQPRGQAPSAQALLGQLRPAGHGIDTGAGVDQAPPRWPGRSHWRRR